MLKVLDSAVPVACWSCSVAHNESTLFCPHCSKIQPMTGGNYYAAFGLEPRLNVDTAELEHQFHKLSRKLHPDRFARATAHEKDWSLADTALLNDGYRTLKDPIHRTEYLLKLYGAEIGEEHSGRNPEDAKQDPSRAPADLLEEVFDLNMQLEEMRAARAAGDSDSVLERSLTEAKRKFDGLLDDVDSELRVQWTVWDEGDNAVRHTAQKTMIALLDRRRYLNNLVRDVTDALGA